MFNTSKLSKSCHSEKNNFKVSIFSVQLDSKGEFAFSFTNAQLLALSSQTFNWQSLESKEAEVIVLVTEESTGHHMDTTAIVSFEKYKAKVEFLPITTSSFKPGLPYTVYVSIICLFVFTFFTDNVSSFSVCLTLYLSG